jgi:pyruvate-formate lyase-activating enzyme
MQPTQQCTAACEHCGTFSNPSTRVRLGEDLAERAIRQAAADGFNDVAFSGGEPTLFGKWLFHGIKLAKSLGMGTRVVTNGWWAKSPALAAKKAADFAEAGLDEVVFSTGDQHARFVPVKSVVNGVQAGVEASIRVVVVVEIVKPRQITRATLEAFTEIQALRTAHPPQALRIFESPWMPLNPTNVQDYPNGVAVNKDNLARRSGCDDVLATTTISPDGGISACCGIGMRLIPELQLGNIASTSIAEASLNARADPLKRRLRSEGPERMLAWAATRDPSIQWENMYAHRCQACIRLFTDPKVTKVLREAT